MNDSKTSKNEIFLIVGSGTIVVLEKIQYLLQQHGVLLARKANITAIMLDTLRELDYDVTELESKGETELNVVLSSERFSEEDILRASQSFKAVKIVDSMDEAQKECGELQSDTVSCTIYI